MENSEVNDELLKLVQCATDLCQRCQQFNITGIKKLTKKCQAELSFLQRLMSRCPVKMSQLKSTNIYHLEGIVNAVEKLPDVTEILRRFTSAYLKHPVTVDIICDGGQTWVKVIARNVKALTTDIDDRQLLVHQAVQYSQLAALNPHNFTSPRVLFLFCNGGSLVASSQLHQLNISTISSAGDYRPITVHEPAAAGTTPLAVDTAHAANSVIGSKVNLDVTTLIALVSNVCNGACHCTLSDPILEQQAADERTTPCLPTIQQFLANKQLIVSQSAHSNFLSIVRLVGGPTEKLRAEKLLEKLTIVADNPSERTQRLPVTGHIKPRTLAVFGTGDAHQATTCTANKRFVRAAAQAGLDFTVFLHPPRALTQLKEVTHAGALSELKEVTHADCF
jgi:hypothetical protein